MRKRLLSALLAMAMMLTMLPVSALAANEDGGTTAPTITTKFFADGAKGNAEFDPVKNDCERDTLIIDVAGMDPSKNYWMTLEFPQNAGHEYVDGLQTGEAPNAKVTQEEVASFETKATGKVYVSLKTWPGSTKAFWEGLAEGTYKLYLYDESDLTTVVPESKAATSVKTLNNGKSAVATAEFELTKVKIDCGKTIDTVIKQHEDKEGQFFYEAEGNVATIYVDAKDVAEVADATETLNKLVSFQDDAKSLKWTYNENTKTFTAVSQGPVLKTAGFHMNAADARTGIIAALKGVRDCTDEEAETAVPANNVADKTMYVAVDNLDTTKTYKLVVKQGNTVVYESKAGDLDDGAQTPATKADTVVYFTFDTTNPGSPVNQEVELAEGEYTFTLNEMNGSVATQKSEVKLTLAKVAYTIDSTKSDATVAPVYVEKNDESKITLPAAPEVKDNVEATFKGWKVGNEIKEAGTTIALPVDAVSAANVLNIEAVFETTLPVLKTPGFNMDAERAWAGINEALAGVRDNVGAGVAQADVDEDTMYVAVDNLDASKKYEVVVTLEGKTDPIYREPKVAAEYLTGKTDTVVYFTFNQNAPATGSKASQAIAAGTYTFTLNEVKADGAKEKLADTTLDIVSLTVTNNGGAQSTSAVTYHEKGVTVELPANPSAIEGKKFLGWADATGEEVTEAFAINANTILTTKWLDLVIESVSLPEVMTGVGNLLVNLNETTITLSGMLKVAIPAQGNATVTVNYTMNDETTGALTVVLEKNAEGKVVVKSVNSVDGTTVKVGSKTYTVASSVEEPAANGVVVAPADPAIENKLPDTMTEAEQKVVTDALANSSAKTEVIAAAATAELKEIATQQGTEEEVAAMVAAANASKPAEDTNTYTKIAVVTYLEVAPKNFDDTTKVLTVDITPMYKVVATTDDGAHTRDIAGADKKGALETEVTASVEITLALPAGFATAPGKVYVVHADTHLYEADVVNKPDDTKPTHQEATFVNPNGFSEFVVYATTPAAAKIGETPYLTLNEALAEVQDNEDIEILKNDLTGTINRVVTFTVSGTGAATVKINAGSDVEVNKDATNPNKYIVTKKSTSGGMGPIGGGGGGATTYSVNVPTTEHGTVTVNPRNAAKDATVTITVSPNQGYILDTLTVTDKDGNNIELTKVDSNKYTFKMPASRVEIKASFKEGTAPADGGFTDITSGEYYYDAVLWAVDKGITTGLTETTFGPNASCTRAQMVTFLWRAAGSPEPAATTTAFTDIDANEYYYKAVLWAVEKGITTGATETTFAPNATVTRAQTVTFLYRYAGKPAVSGNNNFTDLEAGEYYVDAVQWAATNGITTGTTETTFSPANNCTRGQIVTFLYRHIVK